MSQISSFMSYTLLSQFCIYILFLYMVTRLVNVAQDTHFRACTRFTRLFDETDVFIFVVLFVSILRAIKKEEDGTIQRYAIT